MKIEKQISISEISNEISKSINNISEKVSELEPRVAELHPEKIYDSFIKVDSFRRELYEIDLMSQNLMSIYQVYASYAHQAMSSSIDSALEEDLPEEVHLPEETLGAGDEQA